MENPKLFNINYIKVLYANFTIFFSFMLIMPLLPLYLSDTFGADKDIIGIVLSGYTLMALISRAFSGYIVDSFDRKTILIICFSLFAIFFSGYILATSLILFAIVRTLHGAPFGMATVSNSTVAIDVLNPERRAEGIGYYGLSNNIATAISPSVAIFIYNQTHNFEILFWLSTIIALSGMIVNATIKLEKKPIIKNKEKITLDRFFLKNATTEAIAIMCFSLSYGVIQTYVAIYGQQKLNITSGSGIFFLLLSIGLIVSRLTGNSSLKKGRITQNAGSGIIISLIGYALFAFCQNKFGYYATAVLIGYGNGHMFPAFQLMFINLAKNNQRGTANSSQLVSWDVGTGLGILLGGMISEAYGYFWAFVMALLVNAFGVIFFFLVTKKHYLTNKLR